MQLSKSNGLKLGVKMEFSECTSYRTFSWRIAFYQDLSCQ